MEKKVMLAGKDHRAPDWTALTGELLACIRGRLPPADFVRFPAVCTAWRPASPSTPAPQLPWLLVPPPSPTSLPSDGVTCRFFSPSEGKTYLVPVPELRGSRCVGAWEGWLASVSGSKANLSLVNPLTRARLRLPFPFTSLPELDEPHGHARKAKAVTSSTPTDPACTIAATFDCFLPPRFLAVGGEHKWAPPPEAAGDLLDMVYHDGDSSYYGVNADNMVFRWGAAAHVNLVELCSWPAPDCPTEMYRYDRRLAVHRPSGDLLLFFVDALLPTRLSRDAPESVVQTADAVMAFRYRGGDDGSPGAWLRLESLGGCSVFLGWHGNQAICLLPQDVPELRTDCVFFIGRSADLGDRITYCHTYGAWVYDLMEGTMEPYCPDCRNIYQPPVWFTPNLSLSFEGLKKLKTA